MNTTILNPFAHPGDNFAVCLRLCNIAGLYDQFSMHIINDELHVTILSCSHLELISRLSSLDYQNIHTVQVFARLNEYDSQNDYILIFDVFQKYCLKDSNEYLIRFFDI